MKRNDHFVLPLLLHFAAVGFALSCGPGEVQTERAIQPSTAKPVRTGEAAQSPPQIHLNDDSESPDFGSIEVKGLPKDLLAELLKLELNDKQWRSVLPIFTGDAFPTNPDEKLAMLGWYEIDGDVIRFRPRFQFEAGLTYFTRLDLTYLHKLIDGGGNSLITNFVDYSFSIPVKSGNPTTFVKAVYPSSNQLPENLLKIYIHFSAPMSQADVHRHIRLVKSSAEEVALPFVRVRQGLWDPDRKRLTLFFHPGRIKRGVGPNLQMGSPLRSGQTYRLIIDQSWKDANGLPLTKSFEKEFEVVSADRLAPDHREWRLQIPRSQSIEPLVLNFPESLDHALLRRMIRILNAQREPVLGKMEISDFETQWLFRPDSAWTVGDYQIAVRTALEDLAGNSLRSLFEQEALNSDRKYQERESLIIPFTIQSEVSKISSN